MRFLGPVTHFRIAGDTLHLQTEEALVTVQVIAANVVRVQLRRDGAMSPPSWAVIKSEAPPVSVDCTDTGGAVLLTTADLVVEVTKEPLRLRFLDRSGRVIAQDRPAGGLGWGSGMVTWHLNSPQNAHYYGFGQKMGFLDKGGRSLSLWATDEPLHTPGTDELYQAIPFFLALQEGQAYGLFVDSPTRVTYDMAARDPAAYQVTTASETLDAYFFAGPNPKDVLSRYTELTGRMELPPKWALGYQQCRYSYYPEARVREVARELRERQIPCDVIYLDIDYMDGYRVFTWDRDRFPDPARMVQDLAAQGFKVVTIVDPGVKVDGRYAVFREGIEQGHFVCHPDGELFIDTVWPGRTAFPDFNRADTRRWWGDLHQDFIQNVGIAGIWNDMNEPSCFARKTLPDHVLQGEDDARLPHVQVHNVYGLQMSRATHEGLKRLQPDQRPFILTRSGYAGIQRYAAVWMGDNHSWWEHLLATMPVCMGMGLSGVPFVGADIGGFQQDADGELLVRWTQMGAFTPFCRNHSACDTRDQEPWVFGPQVEAICRDFIQLRYRLLPFLYNEFRQSSLTGLPVMRPLLLEYPHDPETYNLSDQFLVGEDLLVCPVYQPGATHRHVYLPEGTWVDFWTGNRVTGPAHLLAAAPLERLPLYVRAGAILPMGPVLNHVGESASTELTLAVYAGAEGSLDLYEDDGSSYGYQRGEASVTRVTLAREAAGLTLWVTEPVGGYRPERECVTVRLYLDFTVKVVQVNGVPVPATVAADGALVAQVFTPSASGFILTATG